MMKKLPIAIANLREIIEDGYLYIDKTKFAFSMIDRGKYYFLSRPRRFGKSLFLDTLKEIFEGNKELFKGLYIYDKYHFEPYPVVKISFGGDMSAPENLKETINSILMSEAARLQLPSLEKRYDLLFKDIIYSAYKKYRKPVVVLVDEYDKPILDVIENPEISKQNREILKSFYTVLKDNDAYLKFVFLTGVTKFAKVSIFSGLNNLKNLSLDRRYATVAGYTQNDVETAFKPYLDGVDMNKLKEWYNGYSFNGDRVYNPYDILLFIDSELVFKNYWFSTGNPTFLIKLLQERNYFIPQLENLIVDEALVTSFDIERIKLEPILFQSGYLTIDKIVEKPRGGFSYHLKVPNKEVQISFNDMLIDYLTDQVHERSTYQDNLYLALENADLDAFETNLKSLFDAIPYNSYVKNTIANFEGYYANVIYAYIASLGLRIIAEDVTSKGRIDLTIFIDDIIYILEFKVGDADALAQIKHKEYHKKYLSEKKQIILLGINFDVDEKNISKFEHEKLGK